jgi:hypothetical protein
MPDTYAGADEFPATIPIILDGEPYTKVTFQDGVIKELMDGLRYLKNRGSEMWGTIEVDNAANAAIAKGSGGYEVEVIDPILRITFNVAKEDADYAVFPSLGPMPVGAPVTVMWTAPTTAQVDLALYDDAGSQISFATGIGTSIVIGFSIKG